ncbi:hypothetical protein [Burkholderia lata]|uniref:hypothetical protein n=1 Tax=Burkholderia lata (strain ATCC 17760 / DSM 23089 / LMG 22485 / NCIMB 9086 / R18194 / 383) TaxID=482957 RepID=UPI001582004D|nr:hypothetical protein [Burkholderia lata]
MAASFDERNLPSYRETTIVRRTGRAQRRRSSTGMHTNAGRRDACSAREAIFISSRCPFEFDSSSRAAVVDVCPAGVISWATPCIRYHPPAERKPPFAKVGNRPEAIGRRGIEEVGKSRSRAFASRYLS